MTAAEFNEFWTPEKLQEALDNPIEAPEVDVADLLEELGSQQEENRDVALSVAQEIMPDFDAEETIALAEEFAISRRVGDVSARPFVMIGKVISESHGLARSCTGAVIRTANRNTVWTAGHCLHDGPGTSWRSGIGFWPAADNGPDLAYGIYIARHLFAMEGWIEDGDNRASDYGAIVVGSHPTLGDLADSVGGSFGWRFGSGPDHDNVTVVGYPGSGYGRPDSHFYDGAYQMYCFGSSRDSEDWDPFDDRLEMQCDMGNGASGGPMFIWSAEDGYQIIGTAAHFEIDDNGNRVDISLYSSEHGRGAIDLIERVGEVYP
ncbi:hypothetical protein [Streptomyces carpaticus]|uniref:trypsin-like serine peptidase n=1 Tax=Streptomyces carpaticus TaxID=285558 RepID=UPI0031F8D3AA